MSAPTQARWQDSVLAILDEHHVSILEFLTYTLQTHLPVHTRYRDHLRQHTHDIFDLWSEQYLSEVEGWAVKAVTETYQGELLAVTQPSAGFHFKATRASLAQLKTFSMVEMGSKL